MDFFHLWGVPFLAQVVKDNAPLHNFHAMDKISNFHMKEVKLTANTY